MAASAGVARATPLMYALTQLDFPGSPGTFGYSVNAGGQVAGTYVGTNGFGQAFVYSGGAYTALPTLGGRGSGLGAINAAGVVAGSSRITGATPTDASPDHATVWIHSTQPGSTAYVAKDLGTLGGLQSFGNGINAAGQVVGQSDVASGDTHAFKYAGGTMVDLGTLGGGTFSEASAVNAGGIAVGAATDTPDPTGTFVATYWDAANAIHEVPIPVPNGGYSTALCVNDRGLVGGGFYSPDFSIEDAFLYDTVAGTFTDLGHLNDEFNNSSLLGVNTSGMAVGYATNIDGASRAFMATGGQTYDLNDMVGPTDLTLTVAYSINDAGQIAGYGDDASGATHAFLLTPTAAVPEPTSVTMIAGATALMLGRRRRPLAAPVRA